MKTILLTLALIITMTFFGCVSVGPWAGHEEQIVPWEPTLIVEAPAPRPAPVQTPTPAPQTAAAAVPTPAEARQIATASPKAIIPAPAIPLTAAAKPAASEPAEMPTVSLLPHQPLPITTEPVVVPQPEKPAPADPAKPAPVAETAGPAVSPEKMIDDASKLDSNSTRRGVYVAVAKRFDLGPNAQVRLVNDTYDNLISETAVEEVFITLIQNPNFAPAAQHAILKRADDFLSESARQRITAALTPK
ncbi:MAG: hypothetical protein IH624_15810 [Phycisphaerae bacterium]|nr:hypothetical protein [Phycisphaerae bacterium]